MNIFKTTLIVYLFLYLAGCATGSHIVTGEAREAIDPVNVKLYLEAPPEYETIGIVEASSDVELSTQAAQNRTIQELKNQAAQIGANGVILKSTGNQTDKSGYFLDGVYYPINTETKTATGTAILVK